MTGRALLDHQILLLLLDGIAQVCDDRRVPRLYDLHCHFLAVDSVEQADSCAKENRCQCNRKLIDQACVEEREGLPYSAALPMPLHKAIHAFEGFFNVVQAGGVGTADMPFAPIAKGAARDHGDTLLEQ